MKLQCSAGISFTVKNVSQSLRSEFSSCRMVDAELLHLMDFMARMTDMHLSQTV